jgi:hypothetical protein
MQKYPIVFLVGVSAICSTSAAANLERISLTRAQFYYEQNVGQLATGEKFALRGAYYQARLTANSLLLQPGLQNAGYTEVRFASGAPEVQTVEAWPGVLNRYEGSLGQSFTKIPAHRQLRYANVAPNIDLTFAEAGRMPSLEWNSQVERETAHLYARVRAVIPAVEWPFFAPYVKAINALKKERNAVILAHNYQTPEIYNCVADFTGDSLQLAREATKVDADIIVQGGVHFMAETSKILNPDKTVLIPDLRAGCSLAESITGADVRLLRQRYPGVPVVTYVNTSAEVKAESDICCTSGNAVAVVESLGAERVIFLPDQYLGRWVASQTGVEVILWEGSCMVHERFTGEQLRGYRRDHPGIRVIALAYSRDSSNCSGCLPFFSTSLGQFVSAFLMLPGISLLHFSYAAMLQFR